MSHPNTHLSVWSPAYCWWPWFGRSCIFKRHTRFLGPALFFLSGCACFSSLSWVLYFEREAVRAHEPYFLFPVVTFSDRALLRNDSFGKGAFGVSRNRGRTHQGIDLLTRVGNPVFAAKSGRVVYAGEDKGYGWYAVILHPDEASTCYAHLSRIQTQVGDWVAAGQVIGLSGKTGNANNPKMSPHLHFEIRKNGQPVNPLPDQLDPSIIVR